MHTKFLIMETSLTFAKEAWTGPKMFRVVLGELDVILCRSEEDGTSWKMRKNVFKATSTSQNSTLKVCLNIPSCFLCDSGSRSHLKTETISLLLYMRQSPLNMTKKKALGPNAGKEILTSAREAAALKVTSWTALILETEKMPDNLTSNSKQHPRRKAGSLGEKKKIRSWRRKRSDRRDDR